MKTIHVYKNWLATFFILLSLAVLIGAFGAHGLESKISDKYLAIYKTGNFYHFVHSIGAIIGIIILVVFDSSRVKTIAWLFFVGIVLFSGSLYIIGIHEMLNSPLLKKFGAITPIGGILFVLAWLGIATELIRQKQ